jgi:hypothetical protein
MELPEHPIPGKVIEIRFTLPGEDTFRTIRSGAVVWNGSPGRGGPVGSGVRLLSSGLHLRDRIDRYLEDIRETVQ